MFNTQEIESSKQLMIKKKETVKQFSESTHLLAQAEMKKPFTEIDIERLIENYQTIMTEYADFTEYANQATHEIANLKEAYLKRKIAYLEVKASNQTPHENIHQVSEKKEELMTPTDRMKIWEPVERALYLTWSSTHHVKTIDEFYEDQKLKATTISGVLETYREPVKNKPGDFILKERDIPLAYLYSTEVNLEEFVGKRVTLSVSSRPNNHFAFPAYYVLDAE